MVVMSLWCSTYVLGAFVKEKLWENFFKNILILSQEPWLIVLTLTKTEFLLFSGMCQIITKKGL